MNLTRNRDFKLNLPLGIRPKFNLKFNLKIIPSAPLDQPAKAEISTGIRLEITVVPRQARGPGWLVNSDQPAAAPGRPVPVGRRPRGRPAWPADDDRRQSVIGLSPTRPPHTSCKYMNMTYCMPGKMLMEPPCRGPRVRVRQPNRLGRRARRCNAVV